MSNTTYWGWIIKGLGGLLNIVTMLEKEDAKITRHWLLELEKAETKLHASVEKLKAKIED